MNTKTWNYVIGFGVTLIFGAGCASEKASLAANSSAGTELTPTSQSMAERVYSGDTSSIGQYAPPPGAPANDWSLAEEVRALLTSDKKLAREPMAATVNKGVVTLQGYVPNERDRERIEQSIASLPGVTHVDNQLVVQNILSVIKGKNKEY
jgi:osmotically-inducible protein OsmY